MIDFHCHFLPGIDDGASSVQESAEILYQSRLQGVTYIFATPHFYPDEASPEKFICRRNQAFEQLRDYILSECPGLRIPKIIPGAEVYYFPGISDSKDIAKLRMGSYPLLLIEPPMSPWTDYMLDEIESVRSKLGLDPVIAHVDRYAKYFDDYSIFDDLNERNILIQVNASFFLRDGTEQESLELLEQGLIHFIGSDAHNTKSRPQNIGPALKKLYQKNYCKPLALFEKKLYNMLRIE